MTPRWMTASTAAAVSTTLAFAAAAATVPLAAPAMAVDRAVVIGGIEAACTGIGQTRTDPRWQVYDVRLEFSNARNEYLVGGEVSVSDAGGRVLLAASCDAPWIVLKLPAGDYRVEARIAPSALPRNTRFHVTGQGQMRVVLQFPDV